MPSFAQNGEKPPFYLKIRSSNWFIITTISLAIFTDMFLYGVIVPVIPFALEEKIDIGGNEVQHWVSIFIAIYGAALLGFSPLFGWLADRSSSRRAPLLLGLMTLLGATVLLNIGSNVGLFIAGRILQGASAAVVWTVGLALLADTVPQEHLAQAMGYVSLGMSLGILIAPLLGGVVFDNGGYNAVFGMCYGLIGLDIILRLLLVEKKVAAKWDPEAAEVVRAIGRASQIAQLRPHDEEGGILPDTASEKGRPALADTSSSEEPIVTNSRLPSKATKKPLRERLPPIISLLYSRRLVSALLGSLMTSVVLGAFEGTLPLYVSRIWNFNATGAALLFLAIVIPTFLAPVFGMIGDRFGGRYPASLGFLVGAVPLVCLRFIDKNTIGEKVLLCVLLAIIGVSQAAVTPILMAEISGVVEAKEKRMLAEGKPGYGRGGGYAQAYALFNMAFAGGTTIGPLIGGAVVSGSGWGTMGYMLAILYGFSAIPTFLWMGGWFFGKKKAISS